MRDANGKRGAIPPVSAAGLVSGLTVIAMARQSAGLCPQRA